MKRGEGARSGEGIGSQKCTGLRTRDACKGEKRGKQEIRQSEALLEDNAR